MISTCFGGTLCYRASKRKNEWGGREIEEEKEKRRERKKKKQKGKEKTQLTDAPDPTHRKTTPA